MTMLYWMLVAHFALDYPLQGDTTAIQKSPNCTNALSPKCPLERLD